MSRRCIPLCVPKTSRQEQLVALAARHRVPAIYEWSEFVKAGGLMSYGTVVREGLHKGGIYAGRILKEEKAAELPVEQLDKLELALNLKTAKALGLTVPPALLARADDAGGRILVHFVAALHFLGTSRITLGSSDRTDPRRLT